MKRLLITGGSGFIGKNLCEYLSSKYIIFCPSHKQLELLDSNAVFNYVVDNNIDIIVHSAIHVPMFNSVENEYKNDMLMFGNIVQLSNYVEKIIYFGSGAEYDKRRDIDLFAEEQIENSNPITDYGKAKKEMNKIARASTNIYNLRLFGVFGKYELWNIKFLSNVILKTIYDIPISIRKDCYFDYLYINDLCKIVEWFIENSPNYHDYNVCHGENILLSNYAKMVLKVAKKDVPISFINCGKDKKYSGSNKRLIAEIGSDFKFISYNTAIEELLEYYRKRQDIDLSILRESR